MAFVEQVLKRRQLFVYVITALCVIAIGLLVPNVIWNLKRLQSAASDNIQWTLSQTEVEGVEFMRAVDDAISDPEPDFEVLRIKFDIFYSRISTLNSGKLYADMDKRPEIAGPLAKTMTFLDKLVPVIDGPDARLQNALPGISQEFQPLRLELRDLATAGLYFFAKESDARRKAVSITLYRLAVLTLVLIAALLYMIWRSKKIRREIEERGRELGIAYARANTILSTSLDAAIVTDLYGSIIDFNASAERVFQYTADEVRGRTVAEIMVPETFRDMHQKAIKRFRLTSEARLVGKGRRRLEAMRRDGTTFPVELALESAQSGDDKYLIAFVRDITHRVNAEQELVDARDKALAGEKAKADFLAMMSHEIRTPLNGLLGNLTLLNETRLSAKQKQYVNNMGLSGNLLMSHVDSVLDIARFEAGINDSAPQNLHLGEKLHEIVNSQASAAEANGNMIEWSWVGTPVTWVMADTSRLQQVLLNLVGNAIKFTRNGRISIEAESIGRNETGQIEVEFRVIDTGIGISSSDQKRIFDDFQMVGSPAHRQVSGTGLGLAIAKRFTEAMGGQIGVESAIDKGSVFWVRLPMEEVLDPAAIPNVTAQKGVRKPPENLEILVVEDNEINIVVVRELLEAMGHSVIEARDGLQGVRKAGERRFDLILMDISMPVMNGLEATRAIREGGKASHNVPIIALSANVLPESRNLYLANGMSGFLGKPLRKDELMMALQEHCQTSTSKADPSSEDDMNEPEIFAKFREQFREETDQLFDWLATRPQDFKKIEMQSHKIAGSAAAFDHLALRDALLMVEKAAQEQDMDRVRKTVGTAHALWLNLRVRKTAGSNA